MKLWVTLEGREAQVEFGTEGDRLFLEVDGRRLEADFKRLPDGEVYSLLMEGRSHEVRISPAAEGLEVTLESMTLPVEVRHPLEKMLRATQRAGHAGTGEVIHAPMPGLVVSYRVKPGDVVGPGDPVVVIEAMKMQNEVQAPHAGKITAVHCAKGGRVEKGELLVEYEVTE
jgi:biotin carboxyl carrier protein